MKILSRRQTNVRKATKVTAIEDEGKERNSRGPEKSQYTKGDRRVHVPDEGTNRFDRVEDCSFSISSRITSKDVL